MNQSAMGITVMPVENRTDLRNFLAVPHRVFAGDPSWVPPLFVERLDHLSTKRNPYFAHAETRFFTAYRDGQPVGRISAQVDRLRLEKYRDATGLFGFLDAIDDPAVFDPLFAAAGNWLSAKGMQRMQGPYSLSINDEAGLLVSGFEHPPSVLMGHARPYYAAHMDRLGFQKAMDLIAYDYDGLAPFPRSMQSMVNKLKQSGDLTVRPLRKRQLAEDLTILIDIFNDAWSDNWGFVPMTPAEIKALGNNLKWLVPEEYVAIAFWRGEPAAMAVTLPNINRWIADLNGRLLPTGWAKLLWRMYSRAPEAVRMPLMGVRLKHHGTAIGSALALCVIDTIRAYHLGRGTQRAELSWILESNEPMRRVVERIGAKPYKTYRIYDRAIETVAP